MDCHDGNSRQDYAVKSSIEIINQLSVAPPSAIVLTTMSLCFSGVAIEPKQKANTIHDASMNASMNV